MSQNIQNPGHPSYKFLILFSHLLGCLSRQCSLEKSLLRPLENYGIQNPFPMGSPGPFISEITSCQKKNYIQTQLGCLTSKDIIEVEQYSTNSNPSNNLFSNYKSIYIYRYTNIHNMFFYQLFTSIKSIDFTQRGREFFNASQVLSFNLFTEEYPDMRKQDAFGINVKNGGYMWL